MPDTKTPGSAMPGDISPSQAGNSDQTDPARIAPQTPPTAASPGGAIAAAATAGKQAAAKAGKPAKQPRSEATKATGAPDDDAVALLQEQHRSIGKLIDSYGRSQDAGRKEDIVAEIRTAVAAHARLRDDIFYPACSGKVDDAILRRAQVRQRSALDLAADLRRGGADDYADAKVAVLGELVKQQAVEDERRLFAAARSAGLDMRQLADRLSRRKAELARDGEPAAAGGMNAATNMDRKETDMPQQDNRWRHEQLPHRDDDEDRRRYGRQTDRWRHGDEDNQRRYGRQAGGYGEVRDEESGYGTRGMDYRAAGDRGRQMGDDEGEHGPSGERYGRQRPEDAEDDRRYRAAGGYGDAEHPRRWDREDERRGPQNSGRMMSDEDWEQRQGRRHQDDDRGGYGAYGGGRGRQENEYQRRYGGGRGAYDDDRDRHDHDAGGYELSRGYRREDNGGEDAHRRYGGPREQWPDDQRHPQRLGQGYDENDHRRYAGGGRSRYDVEEDERRDRDQRARASRHEEERGSSGGRGRDSDRYDNQRPLGSYGRSRY